MSSCAETTGSSRQNLGKRHLFDHQTTVSNLDLPSRHKIRQKAPQKGKRRRIVALSEAPMFLGNMQSFYRRNSIHNQSSSHGAQSKNSTEHMKRVRRLGKNEKGEDEDDEHYRKTSPVRRRSFSISRNPEDYEEEPVANTLSTTNVPVIKVGLYDPEPPKQTFNILKEKERALWYNISREADNSERLGPNKNNIIEESLERDKKD